MNREGDEEAIEIGKGIIEAVQVLQGSALQIVTARYAGVPPAKTPTIQISGTIQKSLRLSSCPLFTNTSIQFIKGTISRYAENCIIE